MEEFPSTGNETWPTILRTSILCSLHEHIGDCGITVSLVILNLQEQDVHLYTKSANTIDRILNIEESYKNPE